MKSGMSMYIISPHLLVTSQICSLFVSISIFRIVDDTKTATAGNAKWSPFSPTRSAIPTDRVLVESEEYTDDHWANSPGFEDMLTPGAAGVHLQSPTSHFPNVGSRTLTKLTKELVREIEKQEKEGKIVYDESVEMSNFQIEEQIEYEY